VGLLGDFMEGRQEASNNLNNWMNEALDGLLGPTGIPDRLRAANLFLNPAVNVDQAQRHTRTALDPSVRGADRALAIGQGLLEVGGLAIPAIASRLTPRLPGQNLGDEAARAMTETFANVSSRPEATALRDFGADQGVDFMRGTSGSVPPSGLLGDAAASPTMVDVYDARAAQMELPPANRIQPDPNRTRIVDADYQTPPPGEVFPEGINRYPRNPDPSAPLPKGDRGRILVEKREELAKAMAEKIRKTGQLGSDTQFFYHSDGPIYRAAKNAGLTDPEAKDFLRDFSQSFAATSPRTKVEENLRNASSAMSKQAAGIPHRQIVGPGSGGISERGYPMMTGEPGGIHGQLLDQVYDTGGIDINKNPKPANFGANMAGDRSGVTVDTHAVRGTLQTLNEMYPGSVPDGYILPKYKEAYKADPSILTPNMLDDRPASQMVTLNGERVKAQTEYPVFADIFHGAADDLGVSPAEAQSMAWFGFGDQTNLGSAHKTVADVLDERISVTAQAMGITPDEAARLYFRRAIPLMGVAGGGLGLLGAGEARKPEQEGLL